jgi:CheY-like chemotaxis protein
LLAGRKLLLADDSPTIQKVVELTFADEGVEVISVGSGAEALERLAESKPDVVLADVYMPPPSGYEICKFIKQNAELKHIPVMLLVGSFEPFDEAEARRVGADDILTKPFQSIRRLIERVGLLVSHKEDPDQVPTAELLHVADEPEPQKMSTDELELTTANTKPLPEGHALGTVTSEPAVVSPPQNGSDFKFKSQAITSDNQMETNNLHAESAIESGDVLLDLGDLPPAHLSNAEDFVLDIDLGEPKAVAPAVSSVPTNAPAFVEPQISLPASVDWQLEKEPSDLLLSRNADEFNAPVSQSAQMEDTLGWMRQSTSVSAESSEATSPAEELPKLERVFDEPAESREAVATTPRGSGDLSAEQIDAIARRAVELLSAKVVQEIAWEVVPQLAELMIKRKLEEQETQPK